MHRANSPQSSHCIPLIIGVAGHRNLCPEDVPALKERVREVFRELRQRLPNTPLVLLSPLNEGADRLVAEVALEPKCGVSLIAVLPWPKEIYPEGHFRSGDRAEFDRLLASAADIIYVPLDKKEKVRPEDLPVSEDKRGVQYRYVGKMIARHSQLLIALWDGREVKDSATWRVIEWQRNGVDAPYAVPFGELDDAEPGPICHIVTPRVGCPRPAGAFELKHLFPRSDVSEREKEKEKEKPQIDAAYSFWGRIDRFNRDASEISHRSEAAVMESRRDLADENTAAKLSAPVRSLLEHFALADSVSRQFQKRTLRTVRWLFVLAFGSVMFLETYAHSDEPERRVLFVHLLLLAVGFGWYVVAQSREIQGRYLDYRALAEALRVQLFWRWAGLPDSAADHYLRHFRGDLDWIRAAARTCFLISGGHDGKTADSTASDKTPASYEIVEALREVRQRWVEGQLNYFSEKGTENHKSHKDYDIAALSCFVAAVVLAAVQLLLPTMSHGLILLLFTLLVTTAMLEDFADYRAFAVQSRMFRWMAQLYTRANDRLKHLLESPAVVTEKEISSAQALIWELGKEALAENADWVVQHRQRPPIWKHG